MIDGLKPNPAMKDSGVPWLGEVPEHWEVRKLRQVLRRCAERNRPDLPLLSVVREKGVILRDTTRADENHNYIPDDLSNYKVVRTGQFAMNKMKAWQGSYGVSQHDGIVSPAYFVFDLTDIAGAFFNRAIRSRAYVPSFTQASDGVRIGQWDLSETRMREIPVLVPSLPEQAAIVRFLDHADRRIRRYIRAKQKLIKLLEEQKQAIVHRAVTRGLDPNVRLKPSGVEWLGDVPEHWEVVPLKFVSARIQNGSTPSTSEAAFYDNGTVPWYGPSSCAQGELLAAPVRHLSETAFTAGRARVIHGPALLVVVIGATAGRMALLAHDGATNQQITSYELRTQRVFPRFVLHQLRGAERWLRSTASTATIPILDGSVVSRLSLAMPSVTEQESILRRADEDTVDLARAIARAGREISLLREYRTRLIADVVTGKLDVREAAARLPQEAEDIEPPDATDGEPDADESADDLDAEAEETAA